jgi:hypothetical protein
MRTQLAILTVAITFLTATPVSAVKVYRQRSEGLADVKVYEVNSEGLADCIIYLVHSEGLASGNAKWYYVNSEGLADVEVFFTNSEGLADKKIYFTKSEGLAKCEVDWISYKKTSAHWLSIGCAPAQPSATELLRDLVLPQCDSF